MKLKVEHVTTDVLVLGGGMAGFRAALAARRSGVDVTMAYRAKGASQYVIGFNAPIGAVDERDSPQIYYDDIIRGGYGLNERRLVRLLAEKSIETFHELEQLGVPFAKTDQHPGGRNGKTRQRLLSGNTYPRSVYVPDGTGAAIMQALAASAREKGVNTIAGPRIVDLLRDGDEVVGALLWKPHTQEMIAVRARAVVVAMGGIGRLYADSTYPADVGADAFGLALDAGASLIDMEFVQFEPVVTVWPEECKGMEMPTAMLGDGAHLLNNKGERFMLAYNPPLGERGIEKAKMSLCIQREIDEGRGFPQGGVAFDATVLEPHQLESYVSHCRRLRAAGVDPSTTAPIVAPAAHSIMGGIAVDERCWSGVPGLFVGGEAVGGVHGASRIAGSGCSDPLVFGALAGLSAATELPGGRARDWDAIAAHSVGKLRSQGGGDAHASEAFRDMKEQLRQILSTTAGIWRDGRRLAGGIAMVEEIQRSLPAMQPRDIEAAVELGETRRMADVGSIIIRAALCRTESRGAHQRTDFPQRDDAAWLRHVTFSQEPGGRLTQGFSSLQ